MNGKISVISGLTGRMTALFGLIVLLGCLALGFAGTERAGALLEEDARDAMLKEVRYLAANQETRVNERLKVAQMTADRNVIRGRFGDRETTLAEKIEILQRDLEQAKSLGIQRMGLIDKAGNAVYHNGTTANQADRDYFRRAMAGEANVSSSIISKLDNSVIFVFAAPVRHYATGEITSVVTAVMDGTKFSQILGQVKFAQTGYAFAVDSSGKIIAHKEIDYVLKQENLLEKAKTDPELAQLAGAVEQMAKGEEGIAVYRYNNQDMLIAFSPIKSTGWSIALTAPRGEVLSRVSGLKRDFIILSGLIILIAAAATLFIARGIVRPLRLAVARLGAIAAGDFTQPVPEDFLRRGDEIGDLARAVGRLQQDMRNLIAGVRTEAHALAGNSESLSASSQEVAAAAGETARAVEEVAKGASEQAENLQQVAKLVNDISKQLDNVYNSFTDIKTGSETAAAAADKGKQELTALTASIDTVRQAFRQVSDKLSGLGTVVGQVGEIISVITGIAEQTNLLALNAAIEAARAGEAGRGFAVVAEEVRKLAEESRRSADKIRELLGAISGETKAVIATSQTTDQHVAAQLDTVKQTVQAFDAVLAAVLAIAPLVAAGFKEMNATVNTKDAVLSRVQDISALAGAAAAAAEQMAASAEELSASTEEIAAGAQQTLGVANKLTGQVDKFKL